MINSAVSTLKSLRSLFTLTAVYSKISELNSLSIIKLITMRFILPVLLRSALLQVCNQFSVLVHFLGGFVSESIELVQIVRQTKPEVQSNKKLGHVPCRCSLLSGL